MTCGSCFNEQHHLARHDLHPCDCPHPRCVTDSDDREADEYDRDIREAFGFYDLSLPVEDIDYWYERTEQIVPDGARVIRLHPSLLGES